MVDFRWKERKIFKRFFPSSFTCVSLLPPCRCSEPTGVSYANSLISSLRLGQLVGVNPLIVHLVTSVVSCRIRPTMATVECDNLMLFQLARHFYFLFSLAFLLPSRSKQYWPRLPDVAQFQARDHSQAGDVASGQFGAIHRLQTQVGRYRRSSRVLVRGQQEISAFDDRREYGEGKCRSVI